MRNYLVACRRERYLHGAVPGFGADAVLGSPLVGVTLADGCKSGSQGFTFPHHRAAEGETDGQCCMFDNRLFAPRRAAVLCIDSLYRHIDSACGVGRQVKRVSVVLAHVPVEEVAPRAVGVGVCVQDILFATCGAYPQGVGEVSRCGLRVRPVAPVDGQYAVAVRQFGFRGRSGGAVGGADRLMNNERVVAAGYAIHPYLHNAVIIKVFGIDADSV